MFGHFGPNLAPEEGGGIRTHDRKEPRAASLTIRPQGVILMGNRPPGESPPCGITPLGNHPPGESSPWGITPQGNHSPGESPPRGIIPQGNHPLGNRPPAQFNSNCYWKFRVTPNDWPSQRPNVLPTPLRKPPRQVSGASPFELLDIHSDAFSQLGHRPDNQATNQPTRSP